MKGNMITCVIAALVACGPATAATLQWPGAAPCNGTLQACVDAAASGDTVLVVSESTIAGDVLIGAKSLVLRAAAGVRPRLSAGSDIRASGGAPGPVSVTVQGFTLRDGRIELAYSGPGTAAMTVRDNDITASSVNVPAGILVRNSGSGGTAVQVHNNRISAGIAFINSALVRIDASSGLMDAQVVHNRITGLPTDESGWGILLDATGGAQLEASVGFNTVRGHFSRSSIGASEGLFSGTASQLTAHVYSNVVVCGGEFGRGIISTLTGGDIDIDVASNTIVSCSTAVGYSRWSGSGGEGTIAGIVNSNILAHNARGLFANPEFFDSVNNGNNLVWDTPFNQPALHGSTIYADPQFLSPQHPFLRDGSPAIDSGNLFMPLLQAAAGLDDLDAGGLRRIRGSQVDIGAHEHGDTSQLHTATAGNTSGHITRLQGAPFVTDPNARVFATPSYDGGSGPEGPLFGRPFGVFLGSGIWRIFTQDLANVPLGARLNVFASDHGAGVFTHVATAENTSASSTIIENDAVDDEPERFLLVTQNWTVGGLGVYNPHPVGVFYFAFGGPGSWIIANIDLPASGMPEGAGFNVYSQDRSPNAFIAEATTYTVSGQVLTLSHPLLDGTPCAQLQATRIFDGTPVSNHFDLRYDDSESRWTILNHNAGMPAGARFFVLVDPRQVTACRGDLFRDGFE